MVVPRPTEEARRTLLAGHAVEHEPIPQAVLVEFFQDPADGQIVEARVIEFEA